MKKTEESPSTSEIAATYRRGAEEIFRLTGRYPKVPREIERPNPDFANEKIERLAISPTFPFRVIRL